MANDARARGGWTWLYLLVFPGMIMGFLGGLVLSLITNIFAEIILEIPGAMAMFPPPLAKPFGMVGMIMGGVGAVIAVKETRE